MSQEDFQETGVGQAEITTSAPSKAIQSGAKPDGWKITLPNPFYGLTLEQLCERIGQDRVLDYALQKLVISFQAAVRAAAEKGMPDEEIATKMANWQPGQRLGGGVTSFDIIKNFGNMSKEQKDALLARLNSMLD